MNLEGFPTLYSLGVCAGLVLGNKQEETFTQSGPGCSELGFRQASDS